MILYTHTHTHGYSFNELLNTITLGDSYEIIKDIPDNSIDCIYTDIPYLYENGGKSNTPLALRIQKIHTEDNKKIRDGIDYSILNEFKRVMKWTNCFIWCSKEQILDILNWFKKNTNSTFNILCWLKTNPTPQTNGVWLSDIEYCLYFREKETIKLNEGYENKSKWYLSAINKYDKNKYKHPTIKPLEFVKKNLLHTTQKGDIVLDCFSGSGTTCVACKELGRQFIGIEIDPEYHRISLDRLNGILANGQISFDTDINKI